MGLQTHRVNHKNTNTSNKGVVLDLNELQLLSEIR